MGAKNKVIAGDYKGKKVIKRFGSVSIETMLTSVKVDKNTVEAYEVVKEAHTKSGVSAVGRGLAGSLLIGPVGLLAGLSAKNKGVHTLAIQFKNDKKSLIEVDDEIYSTILKKCF